MVRTAVQRVAASAPGKLMIAGEYAVLEGHVALVAAASRRVRVEVDLWPTAEDGSMPSLDRSPDGTTLPPEVLLTREFAAQAFLPATPRNMSIHLDTHALREGPSKLGLGSSAAASVAMAAALARCQTVDLESVRSRVLEAALEGHRAVAPHGSGADVIASTLGGFVVVQRDLEGLNVESFDEAMGLPWRAVWTGVPARTSDFLDGLRALRERAPSLHDDRLTALGGHAEHLIAALAEGDRGGAIAAMRAHHTAMKDLGVAMGLPVVTEALDAAAALAHDVGGAAKPSGAGGGDLAIALLPDEDAARAFDEGCAAQSLTPLAITFGAEGVRFETRGELC